MALVIVGLCCLALSAVNGAKRLADLSRYSAAAAATSTVDTVLAVSTPQFASGNHQTTRFDSPDSKAGLPSYETAVVLVVYYFLFKTQKIMRQIAPPLHFLKVDCNVMNFAE